MSKPEGNQPVEPVYGTPLLQPTTVDPNHEGEDGMGVRSMTVGRCSHRHANRPEPKTEAERSCAVPATPCCVTSVTPIDSPTRTPLSRPPHFRRV